MNGRPKVLNDVMISTTGIPIVSVTVCRTPISPVFRGLLNFATNGLLQQKMSQLSYDQLYHLYIIVQLQNGVLYRIEKNERVIIQTVNGNTDKVALEERTSELKLNEAIDLMQFIEKMEKLNIPDIYVYDSFSTNCQHFVQSLLNANGITQFDAFVYQNVSSLAPNSIRKIAKLFTNIAAIGDVIRRGGSMKNSSYNRSKTVKLLHGCGYRPMHTVHRLGKMKMTGAGKRKRKVQHKPKTPTTWLQALKIHNEGKPKFCIPRKGTAGYGEIRTLMTKPPIRVGLRPRR